MYSRVSLVQVYASSKGVSILFSFFIARGFEKFLYALHVSRLKYREVKKNRVAMEMETETHTLLA